MGPKLMNQQAEDTDNIKRLFDFLAEEVSAVWLQQKGIMDLFGEVKALRLQNAEKDKRIDCLESRAADLERYSWINDVIVTGLHVKPKIYMHRQW